MPEAARALWRACASLVVEAERLPPRGRRRPGPMAACSTHVASHRARFEAAMDDDFNTPQALGVLFDLASVLQSARARSPGGAMGAGAFLMGVGELATLCRVLGLLERRLGPPGRAGGRRSSPRYGASTRWCGSARKRAGSETSRRPIGCARSCPGWAWC